MTEATCTDCMTHTYNVAYSVARPVRLCPLHAAAPELLAALEPFAALWDDSLNGRPGDDPPIYALLDNKLTVGDLRRARDAIKRARGGE